MYKGENDVPPSDSIAETESVWGNRFAANFGSGWGAAPIDSSDAESEDIDNPWFHRPPRGLFLYLSHELFHDFVLL